MFHYLSRDLRWPLPIYSSLPTSLMLSPRFTPWWHCLPLLTVKPWESGENFLTVHSQGPCLCCSFVEICCPGVCLCYSLMSFMSHRIHETILSCLMQQLPRFADLFWATHLRTTWHILYPYVSFPPSMISTSLTVLFAYLFFIALSSAPKRVSDTKWVLRH